MTQHCEQLDTYQMSPRSSGSVGQADKREDLNKSIL